MKSLHTVFAFLGVVLLGAVLVLAQSEAEDSILDALYLVTDMSLATQGFVSRLDAPDMPASGPELVQALDDIRDTFGMDVNILDGPVAGHPFGDDQAEVIVNHFIAFADVHRYLLQTLSDQYPLIASANFTKPIEYALVAEQYAVEAFSYRLLALIPTRQEIGWQAINSLSEVFQQVEATYRRS